MSMERDFAFLAGEHNDGELRPRPKLKRAGRLDYSMDLLKSILDLPEDCNIRNIFIDNKRIDVVSFIIEANHLDEVPEGGEIPRVTKERITGYDE